MSNEANKMMSFAKMDAIIEAAKADLSNEAKRAELIASVRRIHYDACIHKGFTPEQALELCKQTSLS